jgi:nitrogen fixation/metabolism regulation signal transduction histidine kinase
MSRADFLRRRVSLQVKLVAILMVVVLTPFAASAFFIDQVGKVAANFAAGEAAARDRSVQKALDAHLEWVQLTKQLHAEIASFLAELPAIGDREPDAVLEQILVDHRQLMSIRLHAADGSVVGKASRAPPSGTTPYPVIHPISGGASIEVTFAIPDHLQEDYQELANALDVARKVAQARTGLPSGYRTAFLALVGTAALAVVLLGVFAANRVTRRIAALVDVARSVSKGDAEARSRLRGRDEMAELGVAFDTMLDDLGRQRGEIEYLQRIGAWQDVARRLAHEIKNPLTPIQLAKEECKEIRL